MALKEVGKEVTAETVLGALAIAEPNGWIGKMLRHGKPIGRPELIDFEICAAALAARLNG